MITKKAVIEKMEQALLLAKESDDEQVVLEQMKKVHLLAELMMESQSIVPSHAQTTIIASEQLQKKPEEKQAVILKNENISPDDGTSIFDF